MNDTNQEMESRFHEMLKKKSGQERLQMGFSMFDFALEQVSASVKMRNPHAKKEEIRREIFLRLYGEDFTSAERDKILQKL